MTPLEELLSQALLVRDRTVPRDVVPTEPDPADIPEGGSAHPAGEDLRALCEILVTHTPATTVAGFLTDQLPEPRSALILACVLQLTDTEDAARFWWQYAAGAGQSAAAYCLYLHHLSLGEEDTARWWHSQMDDISQPAPADTCDHAEPLDAASTTTMLRVLHRLAPQTTRRHSAAVTSLMTYMPTAVAVGYLREPDMELPLPGPNFARTVRALLAAVAHRAAVHRICTNGPPALSSQQGRSRPPHHRTGGAPTVKTEATHTGRAERSLKEEGETAYRASTEAGVDAWQSGGPARTVLVFADQALHGLFTWAWHWRIGNGLDGVLPDPLSHLHTLATRSPATPQTAPQPSPTKRRRPSSCHTRIPRCAR